MYIFVDNGSTLNHSTAELPLYEFERTYAPREVTIEQIATALSVNVNDYALPAVNVVGSANIYGYEPLNTTLGYTDVGGYYNYIVKSIRDFNFLCDVSAVLRAIDCALEFDIHSPDYSNVVNTQNGIISKENPHKINRVSLSKFRITDLDFLFISSNLSSSYSQFLVPKPDT